MDNSKLNRAVLDRRSLLGGAVLFSACVILPGVTQAAAPPMPLILKVTLDETFALETAKALVLSLTEAVKASLGSTSGARIWVHVYGPSVIGRSGVVQ